MEKKSDLIGTYVIVRTQSAGVHAGVLREIDGQVVTLTDSRRIWSWEGANSISGIAAEGLDVSRSRIAPAVATIVLTQAIEVVATTQAGEAAVRSGRWVR
jgi:predicted transcriptional regulator